MSVQITAETFIPPLTVIYIKSAKRININLILLKINEKLLALKNHKMDIKFVWIPVHMSIILNKIADVSAKESFRKGEDAQY